MDGPDEKDLAICATTAVSFYFDLEPVVEKKDLPFRKRSDVGLDFMNFGTRGEKYKKSFL